MQELDIKEQIEESVIDKPVVKAESLLYSDVNLEDTVVFNKEIVEVPDYVKPHLTDLQEVRTAEVERVKKRYEEGVELTEETLNVVAEELIEEGFVLA